MPATACPQCEKSVNDPGHTFCTGCGLALKQPCPHCAVSLETPEAAFLSCHSCEHDFWSCLSCGRLYHLDRTSCQNGYCPQKDQFWTTRFGKDRFYQTPSERFQLPGKVLEESPIPAWAGGATAGSDIRWPSLHDMGLILSVQESGVVELWGERGAPHQMDSNDFRETSVCLNRLDLGEDSPSRPFFWKGHFRIPGATSLSTFELSSSPSVGVRMPLDELGKPLHFQRLEDTLLIWGDRALGELAEDGHLKVHEEVGATEKSFLLTDGVSKALLWNPGQQPMLWSAETSLSGVGGKSDQIDYAFYCDRFVLISGHRMAHLKGTKFVTTELPASVIAEPLYNAETKRLTLLLNEGSARSCSTTGKKFSFICDLAGTPSTVPLLLGEHVLYGTEGRYLCYDSEAVRPRLASPPVGAISYANGRVFGTLRDGSMFCFEL